MKLSYLALKVGRDTIVDIAFIVLDCNTILVCLKIIVYLIQIVAQKRHFDCLLAFYSKGRFLIKRLLWVLLDNLIK
jgi:hypothetical protein